MNNQASGFTLIELMIVTAVIGIIAGVAVPNLVSSRAVANERAIIATMRTVATAQSVARTRMALDTDGDGQSEGLGLAELAGTLPLRSGAPALNPPCLPQSLGTLDPTGYGRHKGYLIAIYLPDAAGAGLLASPANNASIDADLAENTWTCVAWPLTRGTTGNSCYFVNQTGEILVAKNATYSGTLSAPPAGAALTGVAAGMIVGGALASGMTGADGNAWNSVN
jgi:prepilin-type N-terminal cleavage/methylation domain-containing protein